MCGIAGYSFSLESTVDRTVAARALLAGIAERGADSVGFAYRGDDSKVTVHKQRTGASEFLDRIEVPQTATQPSCTSGTTQRVIRVSWPTTIRSATERSSGSTTARSPMTTSCSQPMASRVPSPA